MGAQKERMPNLTIGLRPKKTGGSAGNSEHVLTERKRKLGSTSARKDISKNECENPNRC